MKALNRDNNYDAFAWPGGYPIFYVTKDCGVLCPNCANENKLLTLTKQDHQWFIIGSDINWEDETMYCDNCNRHIVSAYGDDEE
jgi:hypothetical protein